MMNPIQLVVVMALAASVTCGCASHHPAQPSQAVSQPDAIRSIGQGAVDDDGVVGLSIAVAVDGEIIFADGFGFTDAAGSQRASAWTIYDIASVGKQFTAAAIMRLIDEGRLSLDDRIRDIVPETPAHFPNATIRELLNHTSGFVGGRLDELNPPPGLDQARSGMEVLQDVELMEGRTLYAPSETWVYCNPGYLMLGVVVEVVSGRPYADFIQNELLRPAGITTMTVGRRAPGPIMSQSLQRTEEGVRPVPFIHMSVYGGQGSVCSSVVDLLAWEAALDGGRIISAASLRKFRSPAQVTGKTSTVSVPYGMAQRMGALGGYSKVGHTGTFDGGSAALAHYPDAGLTIAVVTNTRGKGIPHALSIEGDVARVMLGVNHVDPMVQRQPITSVDQRRIEGAYGDELDYRATVGDNDILIISRKGKEIGRLAHTGDLSFRYIAQPQNREWFVLDGDSAGWWMYESNGFLMEVIRRSDEQ